MTDPALSVVVPAFNEERVIEGTVGELLALSDARSSPLELLVVDDGSTDGTARLLAALAQRDRRLRVLSCPGNRGKGYAVRLGVANSTGRSVAFIDADLSYPPAAFEEALARLDRGADLVVGARDLADHNERSLLRAASTRAWNEVVERVLHLGVPDTQCGFKVLRGAVARPLFAALRSSGFSFDVELLWLARKWELVVERMPLGMRHGSSSTVHMARDSLRMLRDVGQLVARERRGDVPRRPEGLRPA